MGAADRLEARAEAKASGTSVAQAAQNINNRVEANLAMQGTKSSRPTGGSADRMEAAQAAKIYGVNQAQAQKIINTQVDVQRASKGLPPIYGKNDKLAKIPSPLVQSSGRGSLAAGWQSTGPISSVTGNPLRPNTPAPRGGGGGGGFPEELGDNPFVSRTEENSENNDYGNNIYEFDQTESPEAALRSALAAMRGTTSATGEEFANLLAPVGPGATRRVQQIQGPGATIRQLQPFASVAPGRRRSLFGMM